MKDKIYVWVNVLVFAVASIILMLDSVQIVQAAESLWNGSLCIVMGTAVAVVALKGVRFYIILVGYQMSVMEFLKQYFKVVVIGVVLPFKLGDLFRMYCFGKMLQNGSKGVVTVLLDRFSDTLALVTLLAGIGFIKYIRIPGVIVLLCAFLIGCIFLYRIFPELFSYWNHYFLQSNATARHLRCLALLAQFLIFSLHLWVFFPPQFFLLF